LRLSDAAERSRRLDLFSKIALAIPAEWTPSVSTIPVNGVDADFARPEFFGQRLGYRIDGGLGGAVNRTGRSAALLATELM